MFVKPTQVTITRSVMANIGNMLVAMEIVNPSLNFFWVLNNDFIITYAYKGCWNNKYEGRWWWWKMGLWPLHVVASSNRREGAGSPPHWRPCPGVSRRDAQCRVRARGGQSRACRLRQRMCSTCAALTKYFDVTSISRHELWK